MRIRKALLCGVLLSSIGLALVTALPAAAAGEGMGMPAEHRVGFSQGGQVSEEESGLSSSSNQRLLAVGVVVVVVVLVRVLILGRSAGTRTDSGVPGDYGLAGGAICPKCGQPFARNMLSPNLLAGKLCRCPHCGRWGVLGRASAADLAAAEAKQRTEHAVPESEISPEEQLRRQIEASKYER